MPEPNDPTLLDLTQFESLDDAVSAVKSFDRHEYEDTAVRVFDSVKTTGGGFTQLMMFLLSAVSRARGLYDGIEAAIAAANPHAAFPLIRQFADAVAVVLYTTEHPG